jgi:hypothetical protein
MNHYLSSKGMQLEPIESKCGGLQVLTPKHISAPDDDENVFYLNPQIVEQIYSVYKSYTKNFGPTLNSSQILLYIYKQFFNIKNENFTQQYSQHINKLLTDELVLRFMRE